MFLLMDVLEHVEDDFAMFSELLAAASPGAYFLVTVPADEALWSEHDESFGHYRRYDRRRLERLWEGLPVTPLLASYYNTRMYPLIRLIRARNRRRGHAAGRSGTDFWMPSRPVNRLLEATLAGEARSLVRQLTGRRAGGYSHGASLVALLRREPGAIQCVASPTTWPPTTRWWTWQRPDAAPVARSRGVIRVAGSHNARPQKRAACRRATAGTGSPRRPAVLALWSPAPGGYQWSWATWRGQSGQVPPVMPHDRGPAGSCPRKRNGQKKEGSRSPSQEPSQEADRTGLTVSFASFGDPQPETVSGRRPDGL